MNGIQSSIIYCQSSIIKTFLFHPFPSFSILFHPFPSFSILFPFKNQDLVHPCPTLSPFHRGLATRRRFPGTSRTPPRAMTRAWCFQCHNRWSPLLWCGWFSSGSASINSDRQRQKDMACEILGIPKDMQKTSKKHPKNIKKQTWTKPVDSGGLPCWLKIVRSATFDARILAPSAAA